MNSNISLQRKIFTSVLILLLILLALFTGVYLWLFHDFESLKDVTLEQRRIFYANIMFGGLIILTIILSVTGYIVARLYTSLKLSLQRAEQEHEIALQHQRDKIRIKRQLTNNVNHELKTPICSILGYLEMILGNDNLDSTTTKSFIKKSYDQAERLRSLMADLSTITRIEEAPLMIETERIDVARLIDDIVEDTLPQAEQSSIMVVNSVDGDVVVDGNRSLLYSVFRNLIDNSIAYSGGRKVFVDLLYNDVEECRFSIQDNGIGVEAEHYPYIFERFYRVDTGRSRKSGGTGLGLSIVKNAVQFHGGTIEARASKSGGMEFEFTLKKMRDV